MFFWLAAVVVGLGGVWFWLSFVVGMAKGVIVLRVILLLLWVMFWFVLDMVILMVVLYVMFLWLLVIFGEFGNEVVLEGCLCVCGSWFFDFVRLVG